MKGKLSIIKGKSMAVPQKKLREAVLQLLYSQELAGLEDEEIAPFLMAELSVPKRSMLECIEKARSVMDKFEEIDVLLEKTSKSYSFERIQRVELCILRLGVYELFYDDEIPPKVAIAEALRLARKFSTPEAATFVNALLDFIYKDSLGDSTDQSILLQVSESLIQSEDLAEKAAQETNRGDDEAGS
ncbi:MAG: N utilization substance protein B [Chlamydiales bacterium]